MKKLQITIPDEFVSHYDNDKFEDSIEKAIFDLKNSEDVTLTWKYDIEVLEMLKDALKNASEQE